MYKKSFRPRIVVRGRLQPESSIFKFWIPTFVGMTFFMAIISFAQTPSLNLPPPPTQPLSVVFKNVTQHNLFQDAVQALRKSKRVEDFVMFRAERGFIEYHGRFFGDKEALSQELQTSAAGKLNFELKPKSDGGLEILVTAQGA